MGHKNRRHDEQTNELADKYDLIKAKNAEIKAQKEKERLEKYEKPFQDKKDSHELQMALHKMVFDTPKANQNTAEWLRNYRAIMIQCKKLDLWNGFVAKYQLNRRGYEI